MAAAELVMDKQGSSSKHPGGGVTISRRPKKAVIESDSEDESSAPVCPPVPTDVELSQSSSGVTPINYSMDISQLEAPTFTTLDRGPCRSMMMLKWDHGVNLIGKKVLNPMIHCCDKCLKPILIYGRMIPCKHVFCLKCAQSEKNGCCSRCGEKVSHVDHAGLGSIYMCSHGGSRYGNNGCRRTYLSQRDLQAHIRHRHLKSEVAQTPQTTTNTTPSVPPAANRVTPAPPQLPPPLLKQPPTGYSPRIMTAPPIHQQVTQPISVISSNRTASNLITVPIEGGEQNGDHYSAASAAAGGYAYNGAASGQYAAAPPYPNYSHPPPNYPPTSAVAPATVGDPNYYSNYENAYNGSYRTTPNPGAAPPGGAPSSYYRR